MKPSDPFDTKTLAEIFPPERSTDFFEALLGFDPCKPCPDMVYRTPGVPGTGPLLFSQSLSQPMHSLKH